MLVLRAALSSSSLGARRLGAPRRLRAAEHRAVGRRPRGRAAGGRGRRGTGGRRPPRSCCAAALNVSSNASLMRRSVSRIRPASSRSAVSRSSRWRLELLDVRERLVVLLLGQRVDRAELLAAALQALDAGVERRALARPGAAPRPARRRGRASSARPVSSALGVLRRGRAPAARATSPRVTSSPRCLSAAWTCASSAAHARSSAASFSPAARSAAARPRAPRRGARSPRRRRSQRARRAARHGRERLVAREPAALVLEPPRALARSRSARSASRRSVAIADSSWARRSALGPSSGAARRCWITQRAWRSASAASSRARAAARAARSASSRAASASATLRLRGLDPRQRGLLGLRGGLDLGRPARRGGCARRARGPRRRPGPGAARASRGDQTRPSRVTATPRKPGVERLDGRRRPRRRRAAARASRRAGASPASA